MDDYDIFIRDGMASVHGDGVHRIVETEFIWFEGDPESLWYVSHRALVNLFKDFSPYEEGEQVGFEEGLKVGRLQALETVLDRLKEVKDDIGKN